MTEGRHQQSGPAQTGGPDALDAAPDPLVVAIWETVERLREKVENDHDHRLRRIESDLRWVTLLLAAQIVALIGAAISGIAGRG